MKKFYTMMFCFLLTLSLLGCGTRNDTLVYSDTNTIEQITINENTNKEGKLKDYFENPDGTFEADGIIYKYKFTISESMPNADKVTYFVYLSNLDNSSFEQARKTSGLSSNLNYYFDIKDVVLVEWRTEDNGDIQTTQIEEISIQDDNAISIREEVCALYLDVLEDLWNVDSALNNEISQIGINLSELTHLTEAEKEIVMNEFASKHNVPYIIGTFEELCEQGFIDKESLYWKDGLFFSIKTNEDAEWNLPNMKEEDSVLELTSFDAQKWRSGTGAYFFGNCTAQKDADGKWSYSVGQEAIS